eukprot:4558250-Prymnesium_polylepis.1
MVKTRSPGNDPYNVRPPAHQWRGTGTAPNGASTVGGRRSARLLFRRTAAPSASPRGLSRARERGVAVRCESEGCGVW